PSSKSSVPQDDSVTQLHLSDRRLYMGLPQTGLRAHLLKIFQEQTPDLADTSLIATVPSPFASEAPVASLSTVKDARDPDSMYQTTDSEKDQEEGEGHSSSPTPLHELDIFRILLNRRWPNVLLRSGVTYKQQYVESKYSQSHLQVRWRLILFLIRSCEEVLVMGRTPSKKEENTADISVEKKEKPQQDEEFGSKEHPHTDKDIASGSPTSSRKAFPWSEESDFFSVVDYFFACFDTPLSHSVASTSLCSSLSRTVYYDLNTIICGDNCVIPIGQPSSVHSSLSVGHTSEDTIFTPASLTLSILLRLFLPLCTYECVSREWMKTQLLSSEGKLEFSVGKRETADDEVFNACLIPFFCSIPYVLTMSLSTIFNNSLSLMHSCRSSFNAVEFDSIIPLTSIPTGVIDSGIKEVEIKRTVFALLPVLLDSLAISGTVILPHLSSAPRLLLCRAILLPQLLLSLSLCECVREVTGSGDSGVMGSSIAAMRSGKRGNFTFIEGEGKAVGSGIREMITVLMGGISSSESKKGCSLGGIVGLDSSRSSKVHLSSWKRRVLSSVKKDGDIKPFTPLSYRSYTATSSSLLGSTMPMFNYTNSKPSATLTLSEVKAQNSLTLDWPLLFPSLSSLSASSSLDSLSRMSSVGQMSHHASAVGLSPSGSAVFSQIQTSTTSSSSIFPHIALLASTSLSLMGSFSESLLLTGPGSVVCGEMERECVHIMLNQAQVLARLVGGWVSSPIYRLGLTLCEGGLLEEEDEYRKVRTIGGVRLFLTGGDGSEFGTEDIVASIEERCSQVWHLMGSEEDNDVCIVCGRVIDGVISDVVDQLKKMFVRRQSSGDSQYSEKNIAKMTKELYLLVQVLERTAKMALGLSTLRLVESRGHP
ncbi:hypothetical protein ADUPG1_013665, partial [Aduncisulcus paluster]